MFYQRIKHRNALCSLICASSKKKIKTLTVSSTTEVEAPELYVEQQKIFTSGIVGFPPAEGRMNCLPLDSANELVNLKAISASKLPMGQHLSTSLHSNSSADILYDIIQSINL